MIRDRMPDLLALARSDPTCHEPEVQPSFPHDPELQVVFDRASKVSKYLHEMQRMMWKIDILHDEVLTSTSFTHEQECRQQCQVLFDRFNAMARKTKVVLKRMCPTESDMNEFSAIENSPQLSRLHTDAAEVSYRWQKKPKNKITWYHLGNSLLPLSNSVYMPAEARIKFHLHNILDYRLSNCVRDYYLMQKIYSDRCRSKMQRQLSILGRNIQNIDIDSALESGETMPLLHQEIVDDRKIRQQKQVALLEAESLHREIISLEKSIAKLHESFIMVWTLVNEQGAIIDQIENHVDLAAEYIESSKQELKKASNFQNKYRKKKLIIAIILAVVLVILIIIIIVSVKKKHTNVKTIVYMKPPEEHV